MAMRPDNQSAPSLKLTGSIKARLKNPSKAPHRASFGGETGQISSLRQRDADQSTASGGYPFARPIALAG
jgi:hypothetical protein